MGAGGYSIVVRSIGRASPAVCQQIGAVLSLPAAAIIKRIYQAPAVLMEGLNHEDGCEIRHVLDEAGLVVDLEPEPVDLGSARALFDIAVHIQDIAEFTQVGARLAEFLGCQPEQAERLLETPPGVVLGDVSEATVQALTQRLDGLGANVIPADKQQSVYDLFLLDADPAVRSAMLRDLRASGEACDDSAHAVILRSLSHDAAAAIWRRYQSTGSLRVINRAFEQWDIGNRWHSAGSLSDADAPSAACRRGVCEQCRASKKTADVCERRARRARGTDYPAGGETDHYQRARKSLA
jgi:hypothetical protein